MAAWAIALVFLPVPLGATHAIDHRYVILGYVRGARGAPISGQQVHVFREKTGLAFRAQIGGQGFYLVIVHLHDEDVLDRLRLTTGRATILVEARFNPLGPTAVRGTRVDVAGATAVERQPLFVETLDTYLR